MGVFHSEGLIHNTRIAPLVLLYKASFLITNLKNRRCISLLMLYFHFCLISLEYVSIVTEYGMLGYFWKQLLFTLTNGFLPAFIAGGPVVLAREALEALENGVGFRF